MTRLAFRIMLIAMMTLGSAGVALAQSFGHGHHGGGHHGGHIAHGILKHFAFHGHHRSGHHRSGHHRSRHHRFGGHPRHHGHDAHSARHGRHGAAHAGAGHGECHRVYKRSHHDGRPARIGGTQCYDRHGQPYIVSGSRFVDRYY